MSTSELVYFNGAHFAHIVAYEEEMRLRRIAYKARQWQRESR